MTQRPERPHVTGLASMSFQTSDLDEALAYYRNVLGWGESRVHADASRQTVAVVINERQWIELQPEAAPQTDRLLGFGLEVSDAEALRAYLAACGWPVPAAIATSPWGHRCVTVDDPDGHRVTFSEPLSLGAWAVVAAPHRPPLSSVLMHLGFAVADLEGSLAFYQGLLGCREFWRGSQNEKTLAWVQLMLPDDKNYLEFMLYDEPPTLSWLGVLNHFGLEVASLPSTMEEASARLAAVPYPRGVEYSIGKCRHRLANLYDPDGSRAELMERRTYDGSVTPSSGLPAPQFLPGGPR